MPSMDFASPRRYRYRKGHLYFGTTALGGGSVGIDTEKHAIAMASARTGKGVCLVIPNLKRWPHNALVIDPKGEAAEATFKDRQKMGQKVYVLDPFKSARVPDRLRASYNPLADLDPNSFTIKEEITAVSDGCIMRANSDAEHWDGGAQRILSGLIAYALLKLEPEDRNLGEIRAIIRNFKRFEKVAEEMADLEGCGGLAQAGASAFYAKEGKYFVSNLDKNTEWLDSEIKQAVARSSFSLSELKSGKASVFLVLPANYLGQHGRFLRLFVRSAIEAMAAKTPSGDLLDQRCLFLLDEFFSLGYIDEIAKTISSMPAYGLHLFPILHDLGQLQDLYGKSAHTFFANSDAHIFFGTTDAPTLDYVSRQIGHRYEKGAFGTDEDMIGKPLMSAREVRAHVAKKNGEKVAHRMIVFAKGDDVLSVKPQPFFKKGFRLPSIARLLIWAAFIAPLIWFGFFDHSWLATDTAAVVIVFGGYVALMLFLITIRRTNWRQGIKNALRKAFS